MEWSILTTRVGAPCIASFDFGFQWDATLEESLRSNPADLSPCSRPSGSWLASHSGRSSSRQPAPPKSLRHTTHSIYRVPAIPASRFESAAGCGAATASPYPVRPYSFAMPTSPAMTAPSTRRASRQAKTVAIDSARCSAGAIPRGQAHPHHRRP